MASEKEITKVLGMLEKQQKGLTMLGQFRKESLFFILISTILSARARDETTIVIAQDLMRKYPTAKKLASAPLKDIEKIIRRSGFYKVKAKYVKGAAQMILDEFDGKVPDTYEGLCSLPGVGRKVAGCVLVYGHDVPAIPVDTHVHRISNRLGWVKTHDPEKTEMELVKLVPKRYWNIVNEVFVLHGKSICKPIRPECEKCPVTSYCGFYKKNSAQNR